MRSKIEYLANYFFYFPLFDGPDKKGTKQNWFPRFLDVTDTLPLMKNPHSSRKGTQINL